nr:lipid-binding protein [Saccharomyces cerevisiae, strain YP3, Peptide Partial, 15 aa] [Saccharomyces cerevisiae]
IDVEGEAPSNTYVER